MTICVEIRKVFIVVIIFIPKEQRSKVIVVVKEYSTHKKNLY